MFRHWLRSLRDIIWVKQKINRTAFVPLGTTYIPYLKARDPTKTKLMLPIYRGCLISEISKTISKYYLGLDLTKLCVFVPLWYF
jgi:hypothetical protein